MGEVYAIVEYRRLSKNQILNTYLIVLLGVFATIKPSKVADACAIGEVGYHTLLARAHCESLETKDMSDNLNKRHVAGEFVDSVDLGTVDVFVWIILKQVAIAFDAKLIAQHLFTVRAYARQVLYVLIEYIQLFCYIKTSAILRS